MRIILGIVFVLGLSMAGLADDLDDGHAICLQHINTQAILPTAAPHWPAPAHWQPGWEHCQAIVAAWEQRKNAQDQSDEAKNPDLKKTRDLARKLEGGLQ